LNLLVGMALTAASLSPTTLERLASHVAQTVIEHSFEGPIGVYVDQGAEPLQRAAASMVMAALARERLAPVPIIAATAAEAETLARASGLQSVMRLTVSAVDGQCIARGDIISTWVNFWSGIGATRSAPATPVAFVTEPDAEVLTLAGQRPGATKELSRPFQIKSASLARLTHRPGAIAVADVDLDRRSEIMVLVDDAVLTWSSDGQLRNRTELSVPLAHRPTREPFGLVAFNNGTLTVWSSRRSHPEGFVWQKDSWKSVGPLESISAGSATVLPVVGGAGFQPDMVWNGKHVVWPEVVQHVRPLPNLAFTVGETGKAAVSRGESIFGAVGGVGSGSTVADFDGDGECEVLLTSRRTVGNADEMSILSLDAFVAAQTRHENHHQVPTLASQTIEGRAVIAAAGDLDGDGREEVVLGLWLENSSGELLVVRRGP
jgi:hypothetical protein